MDPKLTELWEPQPPVVTPGEGPSMPPSDAIILFDGRHLQQWVSARDPSRPAEWIVAAGILTVDKSKGNIQTRRAFMDYQLHLEWRAPHDAAQAGQGRGNSGVFLASTGPGNEGYELQILDSHDNPTYVNGQAASIYKQAPPLVNACRMPGEWQVYDVVWTAPRFKPEGSLESPATITAFHNGVLVHRNFTLLGETVAAGLPFYRPHGPVPLKLQSHQDTGKPVSFRNIWLREI